MEANLVSRSHSVGRNLWVFEWCTKYRYKMMGKLGNRNLVAASIRQAAHRHNIKLLALNVQPEHVHAVASLPHGMDDEKAMNLLKGFSAHKLFEAKEKFALRYPRRHFWSRGYYSTTIGVSDLETQVRYTENHDIHHGTLYAYA